MDIVTEPLRMFREGVRSYQPKNDGVSLEAETGDAGPSLRNVRGWFLPVSKFKTFSSARPGH